MGTSFAYFDYLRKRKHTFAQIVYELRANQEEIYGGT